MTLLALQHGTHAVFQREQQPIDIGVEYVLPPLDIAIPL